MRQVVVITGASGGLAQAVVPAFIERGFFVLGISRGSAVTTQFPSQENYLGCVADTTDAEQMQQAMATVDGEVHHLIALAGGPLPAEVADGFDELPDVEVFRDSVELNLTGQYIATRAAVAAMSQGAPNRSIVLCSTIEAMTSPSSVAYACAKAGLTGMIRSLAAPLGKRNIRINAVAPGTVPVAKSIEFWKDAPDHFDKLGQMIPLGRVGTPEDVAAAFTSLACDLRHVTGQLLVVDGGQTLTLPVPDLDAQR